jgi:hypothetical protein
MRRLISILARQGWLLKTFLGIVLTSTFAFGQGTVSWAQMYADSYIAKSAMKDNLLRLIADENKRLSQ